MRLAALLAALLTLGVAAPARATWQRPVAGPVTRAFDPGRGPFESGRHRGVDLAAPPGSAVRAPCSGRVVVAGRVGTSGIVVTLLCGHWRVTHMPLATVAVHLDGAVSRGTVLGTVGRSRAHPDLHLGVRRDGTAFGYADPLRFLGAARPVAPTPVGRRGPRPRATRPWSPPPGSNPRPVAAPARAGPTPIRSRDLAPWPAWAGLALVLAGAGVRWRGVRMRRDQTPRLAAGGSGPIRNFVGF